MKVQAKTPAKINLTLEIVKKREDGFHEINSIMQAVNLYDILTISIDDQLQRENLIQISGDNPEIPYDSTNLAYKSAELFLNKAEISNKKISIHLEKKIPVAAGLAGGSSNAAGVLLSLNSLYNDILDTETINDLASKLGSDINFCLWGGTQIASSRGEILTRIKTPELNIIIVKPSDLFISAKDAYEKYSGLDPKPEFQNPALILKAINENNPEKIACLLHNALEDAILPDYSKILDIKNKLIAAGCINSMMSGSGSSVFGIYKNTPDFYFKNAGVFKAVTVNNGVILE